MSTPMELSPAKTLPVNLDPPIKAYLSYAHILSMLLVDNESDDWIYSNFIQLYSQKDTSSSWTVLQFMPDTHNLVHDQYLYKSFSLNPEIEDLGKEVIIDKLRRWIDKEYYIIFSLDEYYLPGTKLCGVEHIPHAQFIYGYNDEKQTFSILNYDPEANYASIEISYENLLQSLVTEEMITEWKWPDLVWHNPKLLKKCNYVRKDFDLSFITAQFKEYRRGYGSHIYPLTSSFLREGEDKVWGIDIYDNLISYLDKTLLSTEYMPYHLLWEHKTMMLRRLEYIEKRYEVEIPRIVRELWDEVEGTANTVRFLALSLEYEESQDSESIDQIREALVTCKEQEIKALDATIPLLEQ